MGYQPHLNEWTQIPSPQNVGITNNYDFVRSDLDGNITNSGKGSRGQIMKPPRQESTNVMLKQKTMSGQNKTMTTL